VTYVVPDAFEYAGNCHCNQCRQATGSAFKPFAGIRREHLCLTSGRESLQINGTPENHDARCVQCGSLLYSLVREAAYVHVAMGTLVEDPTIRPREHIFVGSKAPWYEILDDLPQYHGHADGPPINR
jgi:hypothetical protein